MQSTLFKIIFDTQALLFIDRRLNFLFLENNRANNYLATQSIAKPSGDVMPLSIIVSVTEPLIVIRLISLAVTSVKYNIFSSYKMSRATAFPKSSAIL
jgi:hypothetical protein